MDKIKNIFTSFWFVFAVWIIEVIIFSVNKCGGNNFLIFRGVFINTLEQRNLYLSYLDLFGDINHYGVTFSLLIAPFAMLPVWLGGSLWLLFSTTVLFFAIKSLPIKKEYILLILWFTTLELGTALVCFQYNILVGAFFILTFTLVLKQKEHWATFFIALPGLTKIIGFGAAVFFLFSKHKLKFIGWLAFWTIILFVAPMFISSPQFVIQSYTDWFAELSAKSSQNLLAHGQNISTIGIIRKISGNINYSDIPLILFGLLAFLAPLIRFQQYNNLSFRLTLLSTSLLFIILFSNGSEHSSYVNAFVAVAIWFSVTPTFESHKKINITLMVLMLLFTSIPPIVQYPTQQMDFYIRELVSPVVPTIIYFKMVAEMLFCDYSENRNIGRECIK